MKYAKFAVSTAMAATLSLSAAGESYAKPGTAAAAEAMAAAAAT